MPRVWRAPAPSVLPCFGCNPPGPSSLVPCPPLPHLKRSPQLPAALLHCRLLPRRAHFLREGSPDTSPPPTRSALPQWRPSPTAFYTADEMSHMATQMAPAVGAFWRYFALCTMAGWVGGWAGARVRGWTGGHSLGSVSGTALRVRCVQTPSPVSLCPLPPHPLHPTGLYFGHRTHPAQPLLCATGELEHADVLSGGWENISSKAQLAERTRRLAACMHASGTA